MKYNELMLVNCKYRDTLAEKERGTSRFAWNFYFWQSLLMNEVKEYHTENPKDLTIKGLVEAIHQRIYSKVSNDDDRLLNYPHDADCKICDGDD